MKLAYLLDSVSRKSAGLFESCRRLAQTSCHEDEITVFGIEDEHTNADISEWAPLRPKVFHALGPRKFGYAPGYVQALASAAPDMAHVHGLWTYNSLAGYLWHLRTGRPLIYSAHGMLDPWALRNAKWRKRIAALLYEDRHLRVAACLHALCQAEAQSIRSYGLRSPICIIPNGINPPPLAESSKFNVESSPLQGVAQGRRILLYLGRLHPKKNLIALLKAWASAQESVKSPDSGRWLLVIAGWSQNDYEGELRKLASHHHLLSAVTFLGPRFGMDKDACYRACDAFILPSLSEGLPMTVLEAWAYAKPVLMTPECNLPEGFAAGAALRIGTNPSEILTGLKQLFEMSDDNRATMGTRGRTLVTQTFSWPRIGEQMHSVYQWLLGGGTAPETILL